ncbi:MAG: ABC transporter ATP-binding protein [Betaproteobacteria bacterium]|nr:ABC transporter ATP-binding protein [Betaproteobacteria bacterium]
MNASPMAPLLEVKNLCVEFPTRRGTLRALDGVSFSIAPGEVLGVVGESGAGKSLTGTSIIGLLEPPGRIAGGEIWLDGQRIDGLPYEQFRKLRGRKIGAIFQDPLTSLNPLYTVGRQLVETIQTHLAVSAQEARERAVALLEETGIPAAEARMEHYPHQFSGGMRQRVVIALALAAQPRLIVADEPTTALDVSIQAQIIALLKRLCKDHGAAVMLVTHDMGVIAETCDRVAVMYAGRMVEVGPVQQVIHAPVHPYTVGLMGSIPAMDESRERLLQIDGAMPRLNAIPSGCAFHPRCTQATDRCTQARPDLEDMGVTQAACWHPVIARSEATKQPPSPNVIATSQTPQPLPVIARSEATKQSPADPRPQPSALRIHNPLTNAPALVEVSHLSKTFDVSPPWLNRVIEGKPRQYVHAVDDLSLRIPKGQTLALVGESGCGKSTVARLLMGLHAPTQGHVTFDGQRLDQIQEAQAQRAVRRRMQMIFQDPYASLNPRWKVFDVVAEPLREHGLVTDEADQRARVEALLSSVGLSPGDAQRFPHQFSGGQRQRISIARALATQPEFLVCDEPTSALDVSVQAQVLNLMKDLQRERGLTYLFISHNLAVVRHVSDQVGVMYLGRLVELAPKSVLFSTPLHPYTRMLLDAIPDIRMTGRARTPVQGEVPNPLNPPTGCAFHPRCPMANARCASERPQLQSLNGIQIACHAVEEGRG